MFFEEKDLAIHQSDSFKDSIAISECPVTGSKDRLSGLNYIPVKVDEIVLHLNDTKVASISIGYFTE